jgi:uncharacterized membrane protein YfcA
VFFFIVLVSGFLAGFLSGLLAVGGGILIIPIFLYLIPLFGFNALPLNEITGISSVQVIMGSLFAFLAHKKLGLINKNLFYTVGIWAGIGALLGSLLSKFISENALLLIYFITLIASFTALLIQKNNEGNTTLTKRKPVLIALLSGITGILAGALGAGGAVLFIPILNYFYGLSLKTSISNGTYIVLITAIMTFLGKTATSQIPFNLVIFVVISAFFGARLGAKVNHKLSSSVLKNILLTIVVLTAVRVLVSIIS